jgi:hypothetical protein
MLAMDVVDTLRHRQLVVEQELGAGERESDLLERLRRLYAAQGIDVPDRILHEGVAALREGRFAYRRRPALGRCAGRGLRARGRYARALLALLVVVPAWPCSPTARWWRPREALASDLGGPTRAWPTWRTVDAAVAARRHARRDGARRPRRGDDLRRPRRGGASSRRLVASSSALPLRSSPDPTP